MKKSVYVLLLSGLLTTACSSDRIDTSSSADNPAEEVAQIKEEYALKGVIRVKLTEECGKDFNPVQTRSGVVSTGIAELDAIAEQLGLTRVEPVFHVGGQFAEAQQEFGLHLWYDLYYNEELPTTRAYTDLNAIEGIAFTEPIYKIEPLSSRQKPVIVNPDDFSSFIQAGTRQVGDDWKDTEIADDGFNDYFNDPLLKMQWHYNNEGYFENFKQGADINVFAAWRKEVGKPEVIVAVVDGGIDVTHEDLINNLWVNEAEKNGKAGKDDDRNGYVDDVHGYNFAKNNGNVTADDHGTHVAGTVAATNNNGMGVSGVAGGDGTPNSGVRVMSCQIFDGNQQGNAAKAIQYAAENGAVIAQCSWGVPWSGSDQTGSGSIQQAIDYFVEIAGTDGSKARKQVGPMKGGIVIFASGNDDTDGKVMPSSYRRVFNVAALAPNYVKASYSNYGIFPNLSAPGGESKMGEHAGILSTLPANQYGYMQGTSMACPHVSGVAALAISKYGKEGFTPQVLWSKLLRGTNDITKYNDPRDAMGVGIINADKVLSDKGEFAPDRVTDLTLDLLNFDKGRISWTIGHDTEGGIPEYYEVIWGPFRQWNLLLDSFYEDYADAKSYVKYADRVQIRVPNGKKLGDKMSYTIHKLNPGTRCYISVIAVNGNSIGSPSSTVFGTVADNQAPIIEGVPDKIQLRRAEKRVVPLHIYDLEEYRWDYRLDGGSAALTSTREGDQVLLHFDAYAAEPGEYVATLIAVDEQGLRRTVKINYTILPNRAPELVKDFGTVMFYQVGQVQRINLMQYLVDPDQDEVTYKVESVDPSIISATLDGAQLELKSMAMGSTIIRVVAIDPSNEVTEAGISVICRNAGQLVDLYPTPVGEDGILYIRGGEELNDYVNVKLYNSFGARVIDTDVLVAPGKPAALDISSLSAGNYKVDVKYKSQKYSETITKL